ncbi:hypothetical protein JCM10908_003160 [Rhodotorula pacifica]|uniref:RTA1 domain-containing protein n=1 Tax=Rhodotorula pacifica TaxID=1495444 RepID=UPI0031778B94
MNLPQPLLPHALDALSDAEDYQYGYIPSISLGVVFIVLFSTTALLHLGQIVYGRRYWFMICMVIGGGLEVLGWSARLWSHFKSELYGPYVVQICCLIVAPTFYSASLYWAAGLAIARVAPHKSCIPPKWFKAMFICADVVSLVVQAAGGGMAGSNNGTNTSTIKTGSNVMLTGIVIQLVVMLFYVTYMTLWAYVAREDVGVAGRRFQYMLLAMAVASFGIIVRGCYRTVELSEGIYGWLGSQQIWQLFDAVPVCFSSYVLNIVHPHWFLVYSHDINSQLPTLEKHRGSSLQAANGSARTESNEGSRSDETGPAQGVRGVYARFFRRHAQV